MTDPAVGRSTLRLQRVLLPTDLSESSRVALHIAVEWARRFGASLDVLHVVVAYGPQLEPNVAFAVPTPEGMLEGLEDAARKELGSLLRSVTEPRPALEAHCVRSDAPADAILAFAEQESVDLLVMSSHGRRGFRRWLLGSVTEEVVRRSALPVLVVPRAEERPPSQSAGRIVVPVDFSEPSRASLALAHQLGARFGSAVDVVHVVPDMFFPTVYGGLPAATAELTADLESQAGARLAKMVEPYPGVETLLLRGEPARAIAEHATERGAGLVVIATRGLDGLDRVLLGSTTDRVLRRAECPVLVLPTSDE